MISMGIIDSRLSLEIGSWILRSISKISLPTAFCMEMGLCEQRHSASELDRCLAVGGLIHDAGIDVSDGSGHPSMLALRHASCNFPNHAIENVASLMQDRMRSHSLA